jgi:ABC-2 type transport system ATP-binding protein
VSFSVEKGEIFGLLGPNGAGKTTTIRMILDIFKADKGSVSILGGKMTEEKYERIGYMPEERGLYQDVPLERCLLYLASLKGLKSYEAKKRLTEYLEIFDLTDHRKKKIKELSKGMQQKAQIINTVLHQPELIIIDEPFTGLDPVNTRMVNDLILKLREEGATIVMSTHMMHKVEELCDRIILIDHGKSVLYGKLDEIRRGHSGHELIVRIKGKLPDLKGVESVAPYNNDLKLSLHPEVSPRDIFRELASLDVAVEKFEIAIPSLDEIFVMVVNPKMK